MRKYWHGAVELHRYLFARRVTGDKHVEACGLLAK